MRTFCDQYLAPPSIPPARRLYDIQSQEDMTQLSIRFLGASTDRLIRTVEISNGLKSPASKKAVRVPPLIFPQGRLKKGKSPKVSKGKVGHLKHAGIAEVVMTDTFESGDSRRKYCQVFYDHVSRFGFVTAMRSKTDIGEPMLLRIFVVNVGSRLSSLEITRGRTWAGLWSRSCETAMSKAPLSVLTARSRILRRAISGGSR